MISFPLPASTLCCPQPLPSPRMAEVLADGQRCLDRRKPGCEERQRWEERRTLSLQEQKFHRKENNAQGTESPTREQGGKERDCAFLLQSGKQPWGCPSVNCFPGMGTGVEGWRSESRFVVTGRNGPCPPPFAGLLRQMSS